MIPGARTLEAILASLPTNASQSIKIQQLGEQLAAAELKIAEQARKISELEAQVKRFDESKELSPEALRILKYIFENPTRYSAFGIHDKVALSESVVEFHFDRLLALGLIMKDTQLNRYGTETSAVEITPEGRAFVVQHFKV